MKTSEEFADRAVLLVGARGMLDGQEASSPRAIADYDEPLMYARWAAAGNHQTAVRGLEATPAQRTTTGAPGWIRRTEHRRDSDREAAAAAERARSTVTQRLKDAIARSAPSSPIRARSWRAPSRPERSASTAPTRGQRSSGNWTDRQRRRRGEDSATRRAVGVTADRQRTVRSPCEAAASFLR